MAEKLSADEVLSVVFQKEWNQNGLRRGLGMRDYLRNRFNNNRQDREQWIREYRRQVGSRKIGPPEDELTKNPIIVPAIKPFDGVSDYPIYNKDIDGPSKNYLDKIISKGSGNPTRVQQTIEDKDPSRVRYVTEEDGKPTRSQQVVMGGIRPTKNRAYWNNNLERANKIFGTHFENMQDVANWQYQWNLNHPIDHDTWEKGRSEWEKSKTTSAYIPKGHLYVDGMLGPETWKALCEFYNINTPFYSKRLTKRRGYSKVKRKKRK